MRIAILHYHLHTGGVNRIIDLAVKALLEAGHQVAVIAGSMPHARSLLDPANVGLVPEMNYSNRCGDAVALGKSIDREAKRILGASPDIWHFHNPTLGKNPTISLLAALWASEGRALVMQLHDFAEQERPGNYQVLREAAKEEGKSLNEFLYPVHSGVRYAVLSSHDAALLHAAGLESGAVILPNPVQQLPMQEPFDPAMIEAEEFVVYPTRAIPRKNLGEAVLWAATFEKGRKMVISLAPEDPVARVEHDAWEAFAVRHNLPVVFDSVTRFNRPLGDFVAGACAAITTSMREGFGMAYLEPWLLGAPVVGRDLPVVTSDFKKLGMSFEWLYPTIQLPLLSEELELHSQFLQDQRKANSFAYGRAQDESEFSKEMADSKVDFGRLSGALQRKVLERCLQEKISEMRMPDLQIEKASGEMNAMQGVVRQDYSLDDYGRKLIALYESALIGSRVSRAGEFLNPEAVLEQFLKEN